MEVWKPVFFGLGSYEVSNIGNVRRTYKLNKYPAGHVLSPRKNKWGHLSVLLTCPVNKIKRHFFIHRLVAYAFISNTSHDPKKNLVLHIDGNPENNLVENLKWGDNFENMKDRVRHGWTPCGEKNSRHKLTASQVRTIKKLLANGVTCTKIAKKYPVTRVTISRIKNKISWRHLERSETNKGDIA